MKKELQSNVNGMTSGGGSIQHPFSIHSASIGSRWKLHGLQSLMMTILLLFTMGIGQMWGTNPADTVTVHSPGKIVGTNLVSAYGHSYEVFFSDNASLTQLLVGSNTSTTTQATGENKWCCVGASCGNSNNQISTAFSIGEFACNVKTSNHKALRVQSTAQTAKVVAMVVSGYDSIATLDKDEVQLYAEVWDATKEEYGAQTKLTATKTTTVSSHNKRAYALDASKRYRLTIAYGTSGSTNKTLYGFSLCIPASGPSVSAFSPATGATVKSGTTVTVTGSTGSTIYYKWATSTQTADDIYNGGSGSHGTAEAATVTSSGINSANGTTLYAIARKGTTNSAVASASYTIDDDGPELVSSVPANSATNVATSGSIVLTFDEEINALDDSKFSLDNATLGTVAIDGTDATKVNVAYSGAANSATVTLSVAAEAVEDALENKSAALSNISFTTVAAETPVCPSGMSISGTAAYTEGQTITLNAALSAGNGDITYTWYKGTDLATAKSAGSIGTGTSYTKANCVAGDAGNYWCEATKDECTPASNAEAYAVTVEEKTCPTSGVIFSADVKVNSNQSFAAGSITKISSDQADVTGGEIYAINEQGSAKNLIAPQSSVGYFCHTNNNTYFKIELECALAEGDRMTAKGYGGTKDGDPNNKGIWVSTATSRPSSAPAADGTSATASLLNPILDYTITSTDEYIGKKTIYVYRAAGASTYFDEFTITRPYTISFASAKGSAPSSTTGFEVELEQITGVSGWVHTGWTADKVVKVSEADVAIGTAMAVDATATVSANTTFTAVWEEDIPAVDPTITFNNGNYTIAGAALNLSTLFSSNSSGAVTYTVKTDGGTSASIDGTSFTATAAGTCVVTASQAAATGYNAATADANVVVSAPSEVDGVKLVEAGALTGNFRTTASLSNQDRTIAGINYSQYIGLSSRSSWGSQPSGPDNYLLQYTLTKKTNKFYFYAYNKNSGTKYIKVYVKEEGKTIVTNDIELKGGKGNLFSCDVNVDKNAEVCISHTSTDVQICQVVVVESGADLLTAPDVNYNINFNKGRLTAKSGTAKTFEGITYCNNADYKIDNSTSLKLTTRGTHYVSFEIPTGQTRKLQVTTGGSAYNVSKTLGDNTTATKTGNHDFNLGAGIWYLNPQGSDVTVTNLKFVAADAAITVAFNSNGGSDVASQALFAGDVVTEPSPAPTKSGYRFVKWQKGGADYDFSTALVAGDAPGFTLDAVWQEVVVVTFDPNNGEDTFTKNADKNDVLAIGDRPADPTKAGYDFLGWTRNAAAEPIVYVDFATETFSAAATLTAVWEVAQDDASLSALSYNSNAIDVSSAEDVSGVQTYTVHLQYGSSIDPALISVTKNAESANMSVIAYDSENKQATFMVTSGNGLVSINYAIQFVIDPKRGTSIIKATTNNVVTGLIGGTIDQSYSGNANSRKLNKGNYFGVTLANDETFQEGDVFIVNITTPADLGKFMIYADKNRTELVADQGIVYTKPNVENPVICPTGEMMLVLPAAANGKKSLYLSRENVDNSEQWNVTFSYIEVTREMNPAIKSFKFGDDAATINEGAKTITIEMPYSTDVTALTPTVEAYGNNGATYTPSGAQDFTSPVNYVVTDAYSEFSTTYAVTVTKAAASTNADLASLAVAGYSLDFDPATTSYNIVLDYGTTVLPAITYEVAEVGLATAEKVEGSVNSATTITVTPEAGAGYEKVYTINFSVSTNPKYVIYDGSTMTNIASATGADGSTGFSYSMASNIPLSGDAISSSWGGKDYTHAIKGFKPNDNSSNIVSFVIPEGYVAKVRLVGSTNSDTKERKLFIAMSASKDAADALDNYIITSSTYDAQGFVTDYLLPNTYYLGSTDSYRLFEFSIQLYPIDYSRNVTEGRFGTICLPNGGVLLGADLYEVAYYGETSKKIFFDEILSGVMEAGVPYVFLPQEGVNKLAVVYTDDADAAATNRNGLVGFIGADEDAETSVPAGMYILQNNQYREVLAGADARIKSYRAYINLGAITPTAPALAPGRRRISMGVASENSATGMDELNASETPVKMMIDGQLYILRGEKLYDATGRLVK